MAEQDDERVRPKKVRFSKLQEVHVAHLRRIDQASAEQYWAIGFDAAEVPTRSTQEFYAMPKFHAVRVAEADYVVAGFIAWRDEAPGVLYIEDIGVAPEYQRFGIATALIGKLDEEAREGRFTEVVLRCWLKADWAQAFYKKLGFKDLQASADVPEKVREWYGEKTEGGRPFLRPEEVVMWRAIPPAPVEEEVDY